MNNEERNRVFVLDTNILFEMNRWTPIELCPEFWQCLEQALHEGKWILLDIIVNEIDYPDTLREWCKKQKNAGHVTKIETAHRERGAEINALFPMIDQTAQKSESDTYLIAYAETTGTIVFSREGFKKQNETLFKIPDVCNKLNVQRIREPAGFYDKIGFTSAIYK